MILCRTAQGLAHAPYTDLRCFSLADVIHREGEGAVLMDTFDKESKAAVTDGAVLELETKKKKEVKLSLKLGCQARFHSKG